MNERPNWKLKLLYDGKCPFCVREIRWMSRLDKKGAFAFDDISRPDFDAGQFGLTMDQVMGVMHGILPDGRIITRVEVFRQAYRLLGFGWLVAPTAWPILNRLADWGYGWFARYRVPLGRLLGGSACANGRCSVGKNI